MSPIPASPPNLERLLSLLRDPPTGRALRLEGGVLDLLGDDFAPTATQRSLDTRVTAWLYDRLRDRLTGLFGMPRFQEEVRASVERLELAPGDVVLDLACGHGNFTIELARVVGPEGLVIGLDISRAMLARAAARVAWEGASNIVLLRADALALPFADCSLSRLHCAGGLHQMPDLARCLRELARVATPDARLAASSFTRPSGSATRGLRGWLARRLGLHLVPLDDLAARLGGAGFADVRTRMGGPVFGYAWARREAT